MENTYPTEWMVRPSNAHRSDGPHLWFILTERVPQANTRAAVHINQIQLRALIGELMTWLVLPPAPEPGALISDDYAREVAQTVAAFVDVLESERCLPPFDTESTLTPLF